MKTTSVLCLREWTLALFVGFTLTAQALPRGNALDFNGVDSGVDSYVSANLTSPPANNYTITAWVYLRSDGTSDAPMAVLGGADCGDSVELDIQSQTGITTDPQFLQLDRCGSFDGAPSTIPVPLNAWTHVAVTVSASDAVAYYINGFACGTWNGGADDFSFGSTLYLGDNNGISAFDGLLDNAQIWDRVLSPSEILCNLNQCLTGNENGLYAWYPFAEGSGDTTADAATAAGGSDGALVNDPAWFDVIQSVTNACDSGPGSLRQAVDNSADAQVITFCRNLSGATILLTSGNLQLNQNLTIDGSALPCGIIIDGNQNGQVFNVGGNSSSVLNGLTITNGSASYGGAIGVSGTLILNECTVAGSTAILGGAIYNGANTLTVNQCTFTGNNASDSGGALFNYVGVMNVNQCTVAGNSAGSNYFGGGGGVNNYAGAMTLANTIVAGNTGPYDPNLYGSFSGSDNLTSGDPVLKPLGHYGGPTPTMPPLADSPAIDGCVNGTDFATDQRGLQRIVGPFADIGAVEYEACPVVTTTLDAGFGSLRYVILYSANDAIITFARNLSGAKILLTSGSLQLNQNVAIDGSTLPCGIVIDGNQNAQVFSVEPNSTSLLDGLTISNGSASYGGAIGISGTLFLNDCTVAGSTAILGGGLYVSGGTATLYQCTFTGNSASDSGGGLFNYVGTMNIDQCTVAGNSAGGNYFGGGGGVNNYDGAMTLDNSIVAGNTGISYPNLFGLFTGGDNLTSGDPLLASLGNYGGPTPTMPPLPGSPAIDGCIDGTDFITDQRGYPRVDGGFADIGAVEGVYNSAGTGTLTIVPDLPDSALTIGFTNYSDMTFTVLTSTNLALPLRLWHKAGFAEETIVGSGQYQFYDSLGANCPQRFYRVRSP